jgi:hypothetical protein
MFWYDHRRGSQNARDKLTTPSLPFRAVKIMVVNPGGMGGGGGGGGGGDASPQFLEWGDEYLIIQPTF